MDKTADRFTAIQDGTFRFVSKMHPQHFLNQLIRNEPIFLWHLFRVDWVYDYDQEDAMLFPLLQKIEETPLALVEGEKVAVQVRLARKGRDSSLLRSHIKQHLDDLLQRIYRIQPTVKQAETILSVLITDNQVYAGVAKAYENLSDWAGGMIRFRRDPNDISRAKFKLLEVKERFQLDVSGMERALDIGAAPGCWTQVMLEWGMQVTAVDTEPLDRRLSGNERLTVVKASLFELQLPQESYDLMACHISWNANQTIDLLLRFKDALKKGGALIVTLPVPDKHRTQAFKRWADQLSNGYLLQKAKHLFHNRKEITLLLRRNRF